MIKLFKENNALELIEQLNLKKEKLVVDSPYVSKTIQELDPTTIVKIGLLIKKQFGKRFDMDKLFNDNVSSVVYEENSEGEIISCCLIDGERMYSTASTSREAITKLVASLVKNNYNIWASISIESRLLIKLSEKAGLKPLADPDLIRKILESHYPHYEGRIIITVESGYFVFTKLGSDDKPQVLVLS